MDAEIILVTIDTKISIKQPELADKYQNLYETTRISWEIAKNGGPSAKISKLAIFLYHFERL